MTSSSIAGMRVLALAVFAAAASLAACTSIDQMAGGGTEVAAQPPANATTEAAPAAPEAGAPEAAATPPSGAAAPPPPPVTAAPAPAPVPTAGMAPIAIQPGTDTGTAVGRTVAGLRTQLQTLANKVATDAQHLVDLKTSSAQAVGTYQQTTGVIQTRLASGTAPGNPELIGQWNTAQSALDTITGNINALSKLAGDAAGDSSSAHSAYDSIQATYNMSGGVDEDQRQLNQLSDEASAVMIASDRLKREATLAIQRQTAYVASERGGLTSLANAIRAGDYTGSIAGGPPPKAAVPAAATADAVAPPAGTPIVTIKFGRSHAAYEKTLYAALSQALATTPKASFNVVGIAREPTRLAENSAERDARAVMHTMGEMGVPSARMAVSAATDPAIEASEVRVYVK